MKALLSYPRSGNHLVRFFIELLSEKPTIGMKNVRGDNPIFKNKFEKQIPFNIKDYNEEECYHKFHHVEQMEPGDIVTDLIFIIREPKEVLLRHNNNFINLKSYERYWSLIDYFQSCEAKKIVLFYEDIITNKANFVNQLYDYLGLDNEEKKKYVLDNIDELFDLSLNGIHRVWGGNHSNGKINFYYPQIPSFIKENFDNHINEKYHKYVELCEKYRNK